MSRLTVALLATGLACAGLVEGALARPASTLRPAAGDDDIPEGFLPRLSTSAGVLCVKQCPEDDIPCDPPAYKIADGRCSGRNR